MSKKQKKKFKKKPCQFCEANLLYIDYKNTELLKKSINVFGKIQPSRVSGSCAKHQRKLAQAVKRARMIALLPFIGERVRSGGEKVKA
ncbi:30S ribosomal protein S18 [Mesomycoplasma conjunctivae]|uniref:Small ribosomal subunit protein bS18 n=1 Tax=Mesomycoplasma conjunctivae (strain ATCC 25834 / NCTC 10147 / HRC/581) TaxID=572263 RepID=C5J6P8_MESCH|nr:30S ribosomal protein S18 [Mesomycoplasma conjunctivae]CAT05158.1 30S ribosomal protein S18 [Mesomycoplasma conjunctivae]VEU66166.1 30S ribosomal protein S18 [Mesomycoplasma conjunctivae]